MLLRSSFEQYGKVNHSTTLTKEEKKQFVSCFANSFLEEKFFHFFLKLNCEDFGFFNNEIFHSFVIDRYCEVCRIPLHCARNGEEI